MPISRIVYEDMEKEVEEEAEEEAVEVTEECEGEDSGTGCEDPCVEGFWASSSGQRELRAADRLLAASCSTTSTPSSTEALRAQGPSFQGLPKRVLIMAAVLSFPAAEVSLISKRGACVYGEEGRAQLPSPARNMRELRLTRALGALLLFPMGPALASLWEEARRRRWGSQRCGGDM